MKTFLKIPQSDYEPLRSALDAQLGYPNDFAPTSIIPNKKPFADGNVYVAIPSEWPTDLTAQYTIDEATWNAAKPILLNTKSVDN